MSFSQCTVITLLQSQIFFVCFKLVKKGYKTNIPSFYFERIVEIYISSEDWQFFYFAPRKDRNMPVLLKYIISTILCSVYLYTIQYSKNKWYSIKNLVEITDQNRCILSGPPCITLRNWEIPQNLNFIPSYRTQSYFFKIVKLIYCERGHCYQKTIRLWNDLKFNCYQSLKRYDIVSTIRLELQNLM